MKRPQRTLCHFACNYNPRLCSLGLRSLRRKPESVQLYEFKHWFLISIWLLVLGLPWWLRR